MPRGDLFPEIGPFETGYLPLVGRPRHVLGAGRQSARPAGAVPARRPGRRRRRGASPLLRSRLLARRHLRPARRRPLPPARQPGPTTPPPTSSPTSRRCAAISASTAGCCSAAPGARPSRSPTRRPTRSGSPAACCAASSSAAPAEVEWFLHGLRRHLPRRARQFRRLPAGGRARRHPRRLSAPADRSRSRGAHAGGARLVGL